MKQIKQTLDNNHTTVYNATHKALFDTVENLKQNEFIKIEYNKIPNRDSESTQIKEAMEDLMKLSLNDIETGKDIIRDVLNKHRGDDKVEYYKRGDNFRNESGYLLLQDENDNWKSVDIRNTVSITSMDGIKLTRLGQ